MAKKLGGKMRKNIRSGKGRASELLTLGAAFSEDSITPCKETAAATMMTKPGTGKTDPQQDCVNGVRLQKQFISERLGNNPQELKAKKK